MKTLLLLLLTLAAPLSAQLIDTPATTPAPASQLAADSIVEAINNEIKHRVAVHKTAWETLWENTREGATPEAILEHMGTKASLVFAFSKANLEHIAACAALVGKQASDFIERKYLTSPRELVHHTDGRVTLAPQ
jgi:hypothetical protein